MADLARLLPRRWDGPRLVRFLVGLAVVALSFLVPAAPAIAAAPTVTASAVSESARAVDAAAGDLSRTAAATSADADAVATPTAAVATPTAAVATPTDAAATLTDAADEAPANAAAKATAHLTVAVDKAGGGWGAGHVTAAAGTADAAGVPAGVQPAAHGSRGPPAARA